MQTLKKCFEITSDIHLTLLQNRSSPLQPGLPRLAKLLFNYPIMHTIPVINKVPINANIDDYCEALLQKQEKADRNYDSFRN